MSKTRIFGDIHGDIPFVVENRLIGHKNIIVGDVGVGFVGQNELDLLTENGIHFIRGNHDDPSACRKQPNYIPDGTYEDGVMFIGGAYSIDHAWRIEGVSWWRDEELSMNELQDMIDIYLELKPRVMITHEIPECVADRLCQWRGYKKFSDGSRTRKAFEEMFMMHKPELWFAGHWHVSYSENLLGTRFIVLNINEYMDVEL